MVSASSVIVKQMIKRENGPRNYYIFPLLCLISEIFTELLLCFYRWSRRNWNGFVSNQWPQSPIFILKSHESIIFIATTLIAALTIVKGFPVLLRHSEDFGCVQEKKVFYRLWMVWEVEVDSGEVQVECPPCNVQVQIFACVFQSLCPYLAYQRCARALASN